MKKLIFVLALLTVIFSSCKKKQEPTPVDPTDYADSLVGTYKGQQTVIHNSSTKFSNANGVITVNKIAKNQVKVIYFYSPYTTDIFFDCSKQGIDILLTVTAGTYNTSTSPGSDMYFTSTKNLAFGVNDNLPQEYYFNGKKQ